MPVGIEQWRAGIVFRRAQLLRKSLLEISGLQKSVSVLYWFALLYLFVLVMAIISSHVSIKCSLNYNNIPTVMQIILFILLTTEILPYMFMGYLFPLLSFC